MSFSESFQKRNFGQIPDSQFNVFGQFVKNHQSPNIYKHFAGWWVTLYVGFEVFFSYEIFIKLLDRMSSNQNALNNLQLMKTTED